MELIHLIPIRRPPIIAFTGLDSPLVTQHHRERKNCYRNNLILSRARKQAVLVSRFPQSPRHLEVRRELFRSCETLVGGGHVPSASGCCWRPNTSFTTTRTRKVPTGRSLSFCLSSFSASRG